jgi:hypothetical protein
LRNSDEGLALFVQPGAMMPATYTPYHGHAYDGPTPAQFYFPPGADSTTMLPQAAAVAAPQLLQLQPLIRQLLGPLPPPVPPPLPLQLSAPPPLPLQLLAHSALPPNQRRTLRLCFKCLGTDHPAGESRSPLDRGSVAVVAIVLCGRFTGLNHCAARRPKSVSTIVGLGKAVHLARDPLHVVRAQVATALGSAHWRSAAKFWLSWFRYRQSRPAARYL